MKDKLLPRVQKRLMALNEPYFVSVMSSMKQSKAFMAWLYVLGSPNRNSCQLEGEVISMIRCERNHAKTKPTSLKIRESAGVVDFATVVSGS